MPDGKKSFVLYTDQRGPLEMLPDDELGRLFLALFRYAESGQEPDFDTEFQTDAAEMAFRFIQKTLDRDAAAWEETREKRRASGSLGGKQRAANQANAWNAKRSQAFQPVIGTVNVNGTVNESESENVPVNDRFAHLKYDNE